MSAAAGADGAATDPAAQPCANCGGPRPGRFCASCGERRLEPAHDHSLRWLAEQVLEGFTQLDSKLLRTFGTLLCRPGQLTRDCLDGRRVRYMAPLQVFFVTSVAFYLLFERAFAADVGTLDQVYRHGGWLGNVLHYDIGAVVTAKAAASNQDYDTLAARVFERASQESKVFLAVLLPFYGIAFQLLFRRRQPSYVPHFVAAVHLFAAFLLFDLVFLCACRLLGKTSIGDYDFLPLIGGYTIHLFFAVRRIHGPTVIAAAWKTLALIASLLVLILIYRQMVTVVAAMRA